LRNRIGDDATAACQAVGTLPANGQFARRLGWTEAKRDAKLELVNGIIVRLNYQQTLRDRFSTHYPRYRGVFLRYDIQPPCDFVFDEQAKVGQDAAEMWDVMK
jgi:hypothetical protein